MNARTKKILMFAVAAIVIAVAYMSWSSSTRGMMTTVKPVIVTPMPVSGYSIDNDGQYKTGVAHGIPNTLTPVEPAISVEATTVPTVQPDVISSLSTAAAVPTTAVPVVSAVEGYAGYASSKWNGHIL
jgi:hypothetical protein